MNRRLVPQSKPSDNPLVRSNVAPSWPRSLWLAIGLLITGGCLTLGVPHAASPAAGLDVRYSEAAGRIIGAALVDEDGWRKLTYLCDRIGHRMSGSPRLEQAVEWAISEMRKDGLENVRALPVKVPHWVRGEEAGAIVAPIQQPLRILGLGGSVGTPQAGLTAEVVAVNSFDELEALGRKTVEGKIVLYNVPFPEGENTFASYGKVAGYRSRGASRAAALGAVAALVRSLGPVSLQNPHTGMMNYENGAPKIPAAAVTIEDASLIQRLVDAGQTVTVSLAMGARQLPDADSANVVGELRGREKPEEIVLLAGHLDTWDVGQGAHDDAAGCVVAMQAVALIKELGLRPRRTLRVALFTAEEQGLIGGKAYREWLGDDVHKHVAAIEMDTGAEKPIGFGLTLSNPGSNAGDKQRHKQREQRAFARTRQIAKLLEGLGAGQVHRGGGYSDIGPIVSEGVPGFGLLTVARRYFDWHHSEADTLDKVNPQYFREAVAAMAVLGYVLAEMPERLDGSSRLKESSSN